MKKKSIILVPFLLLAAGCHSTTPSQVPASANVGRVEFSSQVLSRTVQYAAAEVKSAKVVLLAPDNTAVSTGVIPADGAHYAGGVFSCAIDNVPPGNYKASIEFYSGVDPASSTKIGSGASTDQNAADAGDFTVTANNTLDVAFGAVTLDPNPTGNANSSVTVTGATEATITFQ